ncbi:MAG: serine/threonine protein kinase, partial [Acidobacteria bacterium]|nr:serine/threonine protein kinase [Acidobacteriota bacterium]
EQAALLDAACAGDPTLRAEVESLLGYRDRAWDFIEVPALSLAAGWLAGEGDDAEVAEGRVIGPYRVVGEIGRGGMGAVFLAERADGEFEQRVALKVVRRSFADSDLFRRFRQERQILASLNHPNIARLLDGGVSSDGEPYLVMEYVEGVRIDDYCEGRKLSTGGRLRLFLEVCRGVSYAHQHLVVHRDLKPSNILVSTEGVPKLLDFGIAKLLDPGQAAGEHTRTEMRAFTPDYASPEQAAGGQITTASDVYSLGILLRDLLRVARRSPEPRQSPGGWRSETPGRKTVVANLQTDKEGEDGKTQTKTRRRGVAGGELENIVAMARREDPARRYASAGQLAEDIQRYLDGRPVLAQKDSFTYRAGKFVRRNKVGVAAAALVLLSLVGGIVATVWQARRATAQARVAAQERDRAERRFADVRRLSNAFLFEIAPKIERLEGSTEAREALVKRALEYLDSLARESGDDPQLQSELASAYEKVGDLQGAPRRANLGDFSGAIASYEKARDVRRRLLEKSPEDFEQRRRLAAVLAALAYVRWWTSDVSGSLADSARALETYERLVAERPGSGELRVAAAEALLDLATATYYNEQLAEAHPILLKALASLEALARDEPANAEARMLLSRGYTLQGSIHKPGVAAPHLAKSAAEFEELERIQPKSRTYKHDIARVSTYLGNAKYLQRDFEGALAGYRKAVALYEDDLRADPKNMMPLRKLANVHTYIADALRDSAKTATGDERRSGLHAAKESYQRAADVYLTLQAQNALTKLDRQYLEAVQAALRQYEQ